MLFSKRLRYFFVTNIVLALLSCGNSQFYELQENVRACPVVESILKDLVTKQPLHAGKNEIRLGFVDTIVNNYDKKCWKKLEIKTLSYTYNDGNLAGCMATNKEGVIIFYSLTDYWLSPRFRIKYRLSSHLYILEFIG